MNYRFYLNEIECEEPIGWADFELSMKRDDIYHGMQFEVSTGALRFTGADAIYLKSQKDQNGLRANVTFKAQETCDTEYETIIEGRLNFGKYKDSCGNLCIVEIPFEEEGCKVTFKNRFDQKVDVDKLIAMDNTTPMGNYAQLGQTIDIPAKALQAAVDGSVADDGYVFNTSIDIGGGGLSFASIYVRPDYSIERYNNIATGQLIAINNCVTNNTIMVDGCDDPVTPQLLFEDQIECFDGNFNYSSRKKGTLTVTGNNGLFIFKHTILKWDGVGNIFADGTIVQETILFDYTSDLPNDLPEAPYVFPFDSTLTGTTTIADGEGFYAVLGLRSVNFVHDIQIEYDTETSFNVDAVKLCPSTESQYYMIHEALSRVAEAITNKCIRVKSEYYGRIDSQPFAFDGDGCGSLRFVTSGLKLRNAPDGKFFASAKDLISGLNAIDNIGFDIVPDDTIPNKYILRIERVDDFYLDQEILSVDNVALVSNEVQEGLHYAKINVGYKKWEVEQVNGLNEFNSNREYRTNVETINTTLDILSILVAGSYPIETTRQQSFAESGAADTTYDNEIFIICVERSAYDFIVEQGKVLNDVNIFDPATILNYRISPIRNLLRWFKSIINTYPDINSSSNRLFFNSGTGNYTASGLLDDATDCRIEAGAIAENANVWISDFANKSKGTPLFKNETASFEYPLSTAQYNSLKSNPYGYISYTCNYAYGIQKGFIKEIKFRPARGMASFTLRKKWQ